MDLSNALKQYWPFLLLAFWFGYKWWNSRRVAALLPTLRQRGATLVDVRSAAEYAGAHAPGTVNIPLQELGRRLGEIPKSAPVVVACASGSRSGMARMLLKKNGYADVYNAGSWRNLGR
jgi:rhodanese-related sulfurtransferase